MNNRSRLSGAITFIVTTFGEFIAVYYWLLFFNEGRIFWATTILLTGFIIERGAVVLHFRIPMQVADQKGNKSPVILILIFVTVSEIITWIGMLQMAVNVSYIYGAIIFAILIHLIHSYEGKVILVGTMKESLLNPGTILLSIVETLGGIGLIYYTAHQKPMTGACILLGSLLVEHTLQVIGLTAEKKKMAE